MSKVIDYEDLLAYYDSVVAPKRLFTQQEINIVSKLRAWSVTMFLNGGRC